MIRKYLVKCQVVIAAVKQMGSRVWGDTVDGVFCEGFSEVVTFEQKLK